MTFLDWMGSTSWTVKLKINIKISETQTQGYKQQSKKN